MKQERSETLVEQQRQQEFADRSQTRICPKQEFDTDHAERSQCEHPHRKCEGETGDRDRPDIAARQQGVIAKSSRNDKQNRKREEFAGPNSGTIAQDRRGLEVRVIHQAAPAQRHSQPGEERHHDMAILYPRSL